jgi:hypothetical protein
MATQAKRQREFEKLDKRRAKEEKRALRKAESRAAQAGGDATPAVPEVKVPSVPPKAQITQRTQPLIISTGIPVRRPRA